jgi:hypothetical protein
MPEPTCIDILKASAKDAGCEVEETFNQGLHVVRPWGGRRHWNTNNDANLGGTDGICSGLAGLWLDMLQRGEDSSTFRDSVTGEWGLRDRRAKAATWWKDQNAKPWADATKGGSLEDAEKSHEYEFEVDRPLDWAQEYARTPEGRWPLRAGSTLEPMVSWVNGTSLKRRFFIVETTGHGGHTMAMAKNRMGRLRFYDPNGGIVGVWSASKMTRFLNLYFAEKKIFNAYQNLRARPRTMELVATKYRPHSW